MICDVPVLGSAMLREGNWSRSNSFWGTFRFKRRSATLDANSGFNQQSMIALASSRILESGALLWKDCRQFVLYPTKPRQKAHFHWRVERLSAIAGICRLEPCVALRADDFVRARFVASGERHYFPPV